MSSAIAFTLAFAVLLPAFAALWLGDRFFSGRSASFAGGLLAGAALLIVGPELWTQPGAVATGFVLLALIDRFIHPLCADCGHASGPWATWPLWLAFGLHNLLDGALLELAEPGSAAAWMLLAHRVPEALTAVALLRAAQPGRIHWQVAALQLPLLLGFTLAGSVTQASLPPGYGVAGGALLFLALHRLHRSWRESTICWASSFSGAASLGVLRLGFDLFTRH